MTTHLITPAEAAAFHARASADYGLVAWFVTLSHPDHPGRAVAFAIQGSTSGGHRLSGALVADTIEEVRAMLPAGLRRTDETWLDPVGTVEVWD